MTHRRLLLLLPLALLLLIWALSVQTIPNGSQHYTMIDVGETQIVLNTWGTLHATGYPLYVMSGSLTVAALRWVGMSPATAPSVVSLIWMLAALALIFALMIHLTRRTLIAALVVLIYGLTRTVYIHAVIPEIYSFTLFLMALLLVIALWRGEIRSRLLWLALIGGIGVGQHRAVAMLIPGLVYAVWRDVLPTLRRPLKLIALALLGLTGLLPYAYLVLRANAGAAWVYGEPGTLAGLWDQFIGREASRFIGSITSFDGLIANFNLVNGVLITDLTLPGIVIGLIGLAVGIRAKETRRAALTFTLIGAVCYGFHVFVYTDVLSALILPVTLALAFGWLLLADGILTRIATVQTPPPPLPEFREGRKPDSPSPRLRRLRSKLRGGRGWGLALLVLIALIFAAYLLNENASFIHDLTTDPTGQITIERVSHLPPNATVMIPWGVHHFAVGFARDVLGIRPDIQLVDHKADYAAILQSSRLFTLSDVFYNQPISWWEERIGQRLYLTATAPYVVEIATQPRLARVDGRDPIEGVIALASGVVCHPEPITGRQSVALYVDWYTPTIPDRDLSVFVHVTNADGSMTSADQSAPVYGLRPLTTWTENELVSDVYPLEWHDDTNLVTFGLYEQLPSGEFRNTVEYEIEPLTGDCTP